MTVAVAAAPTRPAAALDDQETAFLSLINDYRAQNGLGPLSLNDKLNEAARWMSNDMAANNYFSHTDTLGRDPFQRMADFGYNYNTWKGENLAAGIDSAAAAFDLWRNSPGHNANMLNPNFNVIGIARAYGPASTYGWYWSNEFGGQGDPSPPPSPPPAPAPTQPPPPPEPTAEPTPEPTPSPTPEPTPSPTPSPTPVPPTWRQIASQVRPWWDRLTVVGPETSVLRTLSYMAERYLVFTSGAFVQQEKEPDTSLSEVPPAEIELLLRRL